MCYSGWRGAFHLSDLSVIDYPAVIPCFERLRTPGEVHRKYIEGRFDSLVAAPKRQPRLVGALTDRTIGNGVTLVMVGLQRLWVIEASSRPG
ncbi:MAG: hypothetical protein K0U93_28495 [Gammaproteobacteria bacterium]|nr:hypothetical protein [Gammaproteobacteria bacterium]